MSKGSKNENDGVGCCRFGYALWRVGVEDFVGGEKGDGSLIVALEAADEGKGVSPEDRTSIIMEM